MRRNYFFKIVLHIAIVAITHCGMLSYSYSQQNLNIDVKTTNIYYNVGMSSPNFINQSLIVKQFPADLYSNTLAGAYYFQHYEGTQLWFDVQNVLGSGNITPGHPTWTSGAINTDNSNFFLVLNLGTTHVYGVAEYDIALYDLAYLPIGVYNQTTLYSNDAVYHFTYTYQIRCQVPNPIQPVPINSSTLNCLNNAITLKATLPGAFMNCNKQGLKWQWEYQNPTTGNWQIFYTGNEIDTVTFTPYTAFNLSVTQNTDVNFRVKVLSPDLQSAYSPVGVVTFSPPSPSIDPENISPVASCAGSSTGAIQLTNVQSSTGSSRYILKNGFNQTGSCSDADLQANNCFNMLSYGSFTGSNYAITGVAKGDYTLILANSGGTQGLCFNTYNVHVDDVPALALDSYTSSNVTCPGVTDGNITLTTKNGNISTLNFAINPTAGSITPNGSSVTFSGLPGGTYTVSAQDACNTLVTQQVTITTPVGITGNFTSTQPNCDNPSTGAATVTVTGGSGSYNYAVLKNGQPYYASNNNSNTSLTLNNMPAGDYVVTAKDAAYPACTGYSTSFTLTSLPGLTLQLLSENNVNCNGAGNGSINLQATGGTGSYSFTLTNTQNNQTVTNTTGSFFDLSGGTYSAVVQKAGITCNDQTTLNNIIITEPAAIALNNVSTDISCYGNADGSIVTTVAGGVGLYTYQWQTLIGSSWATMSNTNANINNLDAGSYQVKVIDGNGCAQISAALTINEPAKFVIDSVAANDIQCYGGTSYINVYARGGNGGNIYQYADAANAVWQSFQNGTEAFNGGTYNVRVQDTKQCTATWSNDVLITAPPSMPEASITTSDYNSYNISCFGTADGSLTVSASGGNGAGYNSYSYQLDNNAWQTQNTFNNMSAGNYTLNIKDGRRCAIQLPVTLTQPTSALSLVQTSKQDIQCYGASTGNVSLEASGGVSPYMYVVGTSESRREPLFTGLPAGNYVAKATDKNGCAAELNINLINLNPEISINATLTQVSCSGNADGKIVTTVTGGSGPYTYTWQGASAQTNFADNLRAGNYALHIADNADCVTDTSFLITEPSVLMTSVYTKPVCYGMDAGIIQLTPSGGTTPYYYSADNGVNWQTSNVFNKAPGNYNLIIKDVNGCSVTAPAEITLQNSKPNLDFLVSTSPYASDTLYVKEVCVLQPDSIQWIYDNATQVLDPDPAGPKIRFAQTGVYPLSMHAWYGACDYLLTKQININPYDPSAIVVNPTTRTIDSVQVLPNPNNGNFTAIVKLNKTRRLQLSLTSVTGVEIYRKEYISVNGVTEQILLGGSIAPGLYILRVMTEDDLQDVKVIINQ